MYEEFDSVARFEMKMIPDGLGDCGLSFYAECGFHCSLHFTECNTRPDKVATGRLRGARGATSLLHVASGGAMIYLMAVNGMPVLVLQESNFGLAVRIALEMRD